MPSNLKTGALLWAAALVAIPGVAGAQDNVTTANTTVANETLADPTLADPALTDLNATNGTDMTAVPVTDTAADDLALANTVEPEREDRDFPWGLLGLLGLAGLMGRKKRDVYVDNRTDRRDV